MGVCAICTSASHAANPLGERNKLSAKTQKEQQAQFNSQFKCFMQNPDNYKPRMEAMHNLNQLVLRALTEQIVLGAEYSLQQLSAHFMKAQQSNTIELYSCLQVMNLLCYQTLYEYSLTTNEEVKDKIIQIKQELLKFIEKSQHPGFLMSGPLVHQIRMCCILLHNLPKDHNFLKSWFKFITQSIAIFIKTGSLVDAINKEGAIVVHSVEGGFTYISDVEEAKVIIDALNISQNVIEGNEDVETLMYRLKQVSRWRDAMVYLYHLAFIILNLHLKPPTKQITEIMGKAYSGTDQVPGITTFFKKKPTSGKIECASSKINRQNYPKIMKQVVESLLIVSGCGYIPDKEFSDQIQYLRSGFKAYEGSLNGLFFNIDKLKQDFAAIYGPQSYGNVSPLSLKINPPVPTATFGNAIRVQHTKDWKAIDFTEEIKEVQAIFEKNRCVSVIGAIGTGKTYFASQVAQAMGIKPLIWVLLQSEERVVQQLNAIQLQMAEQQYKFTVGKYDEKKDSDLQALGAKLRQNLEQNESYFLILPGVNNPDFIRGFLKDGPLKKGYLLTTSYEQVLESQDESKEELVPFKLEEIQQNYTKQVLSLTLQGNKEAVDKVMEMCKDKPVMMGHLTVHLDQSNFDLNRFVNEDKPIGDVLYECFNSGKSIKERFILACVKYFPDHFIKEEFLTYASVHVNLDSYDLEDFVDKLVIFEYLSQMQEQGLYKIDSVMKEYIRTDVTQEEFNQKYQEYIGVTKQVKKKAPPPQTQPQRQTFGNRVIGFFKSAINPILPPHLRNR